MSAYLYIPCKRYRQGYSFQKVGQTTRSKSQGPICWYPWKGLVTINHVKYKSFGSYNSKDIAKVKFSIFTFANVLSLCNTTKKNDIQFPMK
jgi:hypothetical protein